MNGFDVRAMVLPELARVVGDRVGLTFLSDSMSGDIDAIVECRTCNQLLFAPSNPLLHRVSACLAFPVLHSVPCSVVEQLRLRSVASTIGRHAEVARVAAVAKYIAEVIAQELADNACSCIRDELALRGGPRPRRPILLELRDGTRVPAR